MSVCLSRGTVFFAFLLICLPKWRKPSKKPSPHPNTHAHTHLHFLLSRFPPLFPSQPPSSPVGWTVELHFLFTWEPANRAAISLCWFRRQGARPGWLAGKVDCRMGCDGRAKLCSDSLLGRHLSELRRCRTPCLSLSLHLSKGGRQCSVRVWGETGGSACVRVCVCVCVWEREREREWEKEEGKEVLPAHTCA